MASSSPAPFKFTGYQKRVLAMLAFLQFTIVLDFMVLSPLGQVLMPALHITAKQFGWVVSMYAFSAGASGILAAGFADRFDRKRLLLFFYTGFLVGTLLCGLSDSYPMLLTARIVTGLFGGVIGSIVMAITTDLFPLSARGRVMGIVQTAFSASQVLGIPLALTMSSVWGWHAPFFLIVSVGLVAAFFLIFGLQPINAHLQGPKRQSPLRHLFVTVSKPRYLQGFATTALMTTGGFMLMPFGSTFSVHNVGINQSALPHMYMATGFCSLISGPLVGRFSDKIGKFRMFVLGSSLTIVMVLIYTHLGITPLWGLVVINALLFMGVQGRMISASALMSAVPAQGDRGAYMSVMSAVQQVSGGLAAALAGFIVVVSETGFVQHFDHVGYAVAVSTIFTIIMMAFIDRMVRAEVAAAPKG